MSIFGALDQKIPSKDPIKRVKVLGVRTGEFSTGFRRKVGTIYCLVVEYEDGTRDLVDCDMEDFHERFIDYIDLN